MRRGWNATKSKNHMLTNNPRDKRLGSAAKTVAAEIPYFLLQQQAAAIARTDRVIVVR